MALATIPPRMCSKLDKWLADHPDRAKTFADDIGVTPMALSRYRKPDGEDQIPKRDVMPLIYLHTGGAIEPNDFYALPDLSRRQKRSA